jgi:predicted metal-binding membrane protein
VALRCLQQCRNPAGFIVRGWHGPAPRRDIARIGIAYGWSCVGCCWALMALMIVVGTAGLVMMVILTVVMVAERWVRGMERLVGGLLLVAAVMVILTQAI